MHRLGILFLVFAFLAPTPTRAQQKIYFNYTMEGEQFRGFLEITWRQLRESYDDFTFSNVTHPKLSFTPSPKNAIEVEIVFTDVGKKKHRDNLLIIEPSGVNNPNGLKYQGNRVEINWRGKRKLRYQVSGDGSGEMRINFGMLVGSTGEIQTNLGTISKRYTISGLSSGSPGRDDEIAFRQAKDQNTQAAYRKFIVNHRNSSHVPEARRLLEDLAWAEARKNDRISAYENFLDAFPSGQYSDVAERIVRDEQAWDRILSANPTLGTLNNYVSSFPNGRHLSEARIYIDMLKSGETPKPIPRRKTPRQPVEISDEDKAWRAAKDENSVSGYQGFLRNFPASRFADNARDRIERLLPLNTVQRDRRGSTFEIELEHSRNPEIIEITPPEGIDASVEGNILTFTVKDKREHIIKIKDEWGKTAEIPIDAATEALTVKDPKLDDAGENLIFEVLGGKPPYFIQMAKQGSDSYSFSTQVRDSIITEGKEGKRITIGLNDLHEQLNGTYNFVLTDSRKLQRVVIKEDVPIQAGFTPALWMILIGPLLLSLGFLYYRNR